MSGVLSLMRLWAAVVVLGVAGSLLVSLWLPRDVRRNTYAYLLFSILCGILLLTFLTAVLATRGQTIMTLAALPFLAAACLDRQKISVWPWQLPPRSVLESLGASTVFFLYSWLPLRAADSYPFGIRIPHPDAVFFGFLGESLLITGQESIYPFLERYTLQPAAPTPYHYLEIWLAAAASKLLGGSSLEAYLLVAVPLLATVTTLGLWALAAEVGARAFRYRALVLMAPSLAALEIALPDARFFSGMTMLFGGPLALVGKSLVVYAVLCGSAFLSLVGAHGKALLLASLLIPCSQLAAPAAATLVGAGVVWLLLGGKRKEAIVAAWALGVVSIGTVAFYTVQGDHLSAWTSLTRVASENRASAQWGTKVNVLGKTILQLAVAYSPVILLVLLFLRRSTQRTAVRLLALSSVAFIAGGVLGYGALSSHQLSVEFAGVPAAPAVWVVVAIAFFAWCPQGLRTKALCVAAFCGIAAMLLPGALADGRPPGSAQFYVDRYSTNYLETVRQFSSRCSRGGYLVASSEVGNPWDRTLPVPALAAAYPLGSYLSFMMGCAAPTHLGTFSLDHPNRELLAASPLALAARDARTGPADASLLRRFLFERDLQFVIASPKATVPAAVMERVEHTVLDVGTGERFYLLRPRDQGPPGAAW